MSSAAKELCFMTAVEMAALLRAGELSAMEVMEAHLAQIEETNAAVNAIVTLAAERAIENARAADEALARDGPQGPLHGLPVAHKDLVLTKGIRTTYGSRVFGDLVPDRDALLVERLRGAGALTLGKTNTPEFGVGSQTFNAVFGATRNPYDLSKTCGGSSGGAAVALACGMVPIADGSDLGGSLRNPAAFCNVVGLRPSPGRVPIWPSDIPWCPLPAEGPMARTVEDAALLLSAMAGPDARSPIALTEPGDGFRGPLERDFSGVRVAVSSDFARLFPVETTVRRAVEGAIPVFESLGCRVDEALPDFSGADEAFKTWRAWIYASRCGGLLAGHREELKDTLIWNIEEGMKLTGADLCRAEKQRATLFHRMRVFMQDHEFLLLPVTQVLPFDVNQPYVTEIEGVAMETYLDWMRSCYYITVTGHPSMSVPCGFSDDGLPIGLQIVGRHLDDMGVLQLGYAFQQATQYWRRRPKGL